MESFRNVAYGLPVRLMAEQGLPRPMCMGLRYEADDPYAVHAAFSPVGEGDAVEWVFSRDMVAQALRGHMGDGDVRMWPGRSRGHVVLYIVLGSPAGSALLEVPARGVESFLRETESVVPSGTEADLLDLDGELTRLLAGH